VQRVFVFGRVAVVIEGCRLPDERGVRVELRLVEEEPHRGTSESPQRVVIDRAVWRADLFDEVDGEPGNLGAAHFHPRFEGTGNLSAGDRHVDDLLATDAVAWLERELGDVERLFEAGGLVLYGVAMPWLSDAVDEIRRARPEILDAVAATWRDVRS
jgi:hypothetical protein